MQEKSRDFHFLPKRIHIDKCNLNTFGEGMGGGGKRIK